MKKGFKWFLIGTTTVCLSFGMILPANVYSAKADSAKEEIDNIIEDKAETLEVNLKSTEEELEIEAEKEAEEARIAEEEARKQEEAKKEAAAKKAEEKKKAEEAKKKAEEAKKKAEEAKKKAEADKNAYSIKMTAKDKENLYRLVQSEVGYMDEKSKLYVASVVLNRVKNSKFPNTVTGVVMAHNPRTGVYQFSPVKPGGRFWKCEATKETKKAVDKVLKNGDYSNGAIAFVAKKYTTYKAAAWFDNNLHHLFHHNGQDYYRYR